MRFSVASVFAGLVAIASAQNVPFDPIYTPSAYQEVPAGSTLTITWDAQPAAYNDEPVTISLIGGPEQNTQVPLYTIATGIINSAGKYEWTVDPNEFGKNFYGLVIALQSDPSVFQYSNPFKVVAPIGATTTTTAATSSESLPTAVDVPTQTPTVTVSLSTVSTTTCTESTSSTFSAESVPTGGYVPAPDTHNNATAIATKPASTFSQVTAAHTGSTPVSTSGNSPIPTGGAVAQGVSMALLGAAAVFAFAF